MRGPLGQRFEIGLLARLGVLLGAVAALAWVLTRPGLYATTLLAALIAGAMLAELWRFVRRTNLSVARFVEAVDHDDFTQGFGGAGAGFGPLAASLNAAIVRLRHDRAASQETARTLSALIDDVPSPLLSIDVEDRVDLLNKAARRLLAAASVTRIGDLAAFGQGFADDVASMQPGERRATRLLTGGAPTAALLTMAEVRQAQGAVRVIAVQPIQTELDRAELTAQTDLVRVLTHEIMNSMTPVTSLSATAAQLIAAADNGTDPAIADARAAIETVARRAEGVMHFVRTYRQLARPPQLQRRRVVIAELFAQLKQLHDSDWPDRTLAVAVTPPGLAIDADPDLLVQLLLNLIGNAAAATRDVAEPQVALTATVTPGGRTIIEVTDNGCGVAEDLRHDIFLPFFTTKADGTGVGLSLARQIALAHGGALTCEAVEPAGTRFRLVL